MKLELGSGQRPTDGYLHNDVNAFPGIDVVCGAWEIDLPDASLDEVLALGVIEHLTYGQVALTFANVHRMLKSGGEFIFDVPDLEIWCAYLTWACANEKTPFSLEHILSTLYGWQRWPGDEHKSGWTIPLLDEALLKAGFGQIQYGLKHVTDRGHHRNRMDRPTDAHIYVVATR